MICQLQSATAAYKGFAINMLGWMYRANDRDTLRTLYIWRPHAFSNNSKLEAPVRETSTSLHSLLLIMEQSLRSALFVKGKSRPLWDNWSDSDFNNEKHFLSISYYLTWGVEEGWSSVTYQDGRLRDYRGSLVNAQADSFLPSC